MPRGRQFLFPKCEEGGVRKWAAARKMGEPASADEGGKPAPHAQQGRKQRKQREEHHITLDRKILSDCISPLLLTFHLQLIQI